MTRPRGVDAWLPSRWRVAAGGSVLALWEAQRRRASQGRAARWLRRSVLRTDCPPLLASGSRGETRYARFASCARTIAASQKHEARFARRPRGCAARRRRDRAARPWLARRRCASHSARTLPPAANGTSGVLATVVRPVLESATTLSAKVRAAVRAAGCRRARAQPRSAAVPARARSALRTS